MLKPKYIEQLPDRMIELYSQAEMDILADMARRISTYDYFIPAAEFQFRKLQDMGILHDEILKKLSAMTGITTTELKKLMKEAGATALKADDSIYRKAGLRPTPLDANPALQAVLAAGIEKTGGLFQNLTRTTANTATKQFEDALDRAYMQISTGAFDYNAAIRMAVKDLASKGMAVVRYPSGHVDYMEVAVRRATVTGVNQTAGKLQETRADEMGSDLVETTAHAGARPDHQAWQGKVFSRSGTHPKYPDFVSSTGYGAGPGLCGWNCRHNFFPYFEGISEPAYSKEDLKDYEAKNYTYNGQKLTEYEATQQQRHIERQIRRWKREEAGMKAAGLSPDEAKAKIAQWQATQRDFIKQTGLKRQYDREQIGKVATGKQIEPPEKKFSPKERIEKYMRPGSTVNLSGIDEKVAEGIAEAYERVLTRYPQMSGELSGFLADLNKDIYAESQMWNGKTFINPQKFSSITEIAKSYEKDLEVGYHPAGTDWKSLINHELGHALDGYITRKYVPYGKDEASKFIQKEALKRAGMKSVQVGKELSIYASKNSSEFFASAIAEITGSGSPRLLARSVEGVIDDIFAGRLKFVEGKGLTKSGTAPIMKLTGGEERALKEYISSGSYKVNSLLRAGQTLPDEAKTLVKGLDAALDKMPAHEGTVYRSVSSFGIEDIDDFVKGHRPGEVKSFPAYTSASTAVYDKSFPIQYVIKSKTGRDLREFNPGETEILFRRDAQFKVIRVDGYTIYMEEI